MLLYITMSLCPRCSNADRPWVALLREPDAVRVARVVQVVRALLVLVDADDAERLGNLLPLLHDAPTGDPVEHEGEQHLPREGFLDIEQ